MDNSKLPFGDFSAWLTANQGNSLVAALIVVVTLGAFNATRPYAIPLGIIIMCAWFWKWQRKGGHL